MKTKTIGFNESQAAQAMHRIERNCTFLNHLVATYDNYRLEPLKNMQEVESLLNEPKMLLFRKLTKGDKMDIGGVALNCDKAFEILEKPNGLETLPQTIEGLKLRHGNGIDFTYLTLSKGKVEFDNSKRKQWESGFEIKLSGSKLEAYEALQSSVETMNGLIKKHRLNGKELVDCINYDNLGRLGEPLGVNHEKLSNVGNL